MPFSKVGSVWRKWDLHVHTPFSSLNNGFGDDWDIYARNLFDSALYHNIQAIGITDYFTIDGYKKLQNEYINNPSKLQSLGFDEIDIEKINNILILPNIEFRLDILIPSRKVNNRVNFHVLFSEEVPSIDIEELFLHEIDFVYKGRPQNRDELRKLKSENLIRLGKRLKQEQIEFKEMSDLVVGMINVVVDSTQICEILDKSVFKNKYVLAIPADEDLNQVDWKGQGHLARKVLIQKSDFLMASNPNTIAWGLGKKSNDIVGEFQSIKPCIWGSDAHNADELFVKNKDRLLWIKSELTFEGLKQVLHEPNRVFIGIEPESKKFIELNSTNFIDRLIIEKDNALTLNEEWFDKVDIEINPGLVAIIGNKGSGKTAIADIIALCGNAKKTKNFSFLNNDRFNKAPEFKGKFFNATVHWKDGKINKVGLFDKPVENDTEKVNYIPQSFLEKLCLPETGKELFEREIRKIIFSRIPYEKRLNKHSLDEIINFKTEVIRNDIELTKSEIKLLNDKIIELEEQCKPEYRQKIYDEISALNKKILVLCEKEPIEPSFIEEEIGSNESDYINSELVNCRALLDEIDYEIEKTNEERESLNIDIENINKTLQSFDSFNDSYQKFINSHTAFLLSNKIDINSVIKYSFDYGQIENLLKIKKSYLNILNYKLLPFYGDFSESIELIDDQEFDGSIEKYMSLYEIKFGIQKDMVILQNRLDQPSKEYQEYLNEFFKWQQDINALRNDLDKLENSREYVNDILGHVLTAFYKEREDLLEKLFIQKSEIISIYKELYEPILSFKENYKQQLASYKIDFDAAFEVSGFSERFDSFINYSKSGSFYSKDFASKKINKLLTTLDFNDCDGVLEFTNTLTKELLFDTRQENIIVAKDVQSQLKQNIKTEDVYNYIFSLEYLEPIFQLKLAGKEISSLSPGERGALLLIFYLLLDNDKSPLIIDQPEENLDNQSIYSILVPFIQEAKGRRQVILVTHNPNLAVVCDADQIIHVRIDKNDNYKITCTSGSIENPVINELIIEVLEGTFPAFDTRNLRYNVTRSRMDRSNYSYSGPLYT